MRYNMFEFIDVKYGNIIDLPRLFINTGITVLIGASGSGKTTILRMLNKMISPSQGSISFNGVDLKQIKSVEHRRKVTMLTQNPVMFEGTVRDNLTMALRFQGKEIPGDEDLKLILEQIQLNKSLDTPSHNLSGGEKQRLALGRVLLIDPEVYLLDEPSSALDEDMEEIIIEMFAAHVKQHEKSLVMVTHSKSIAEKYADELIEIATGKVLHRRANHERNY
jgi:putative ABC transport system ATP-binding protein